MANDELNELDGRVAKGIEVLRGSAAQEAEGGPSEELLRRTIERARSGARDEGTLHLRRDWRMKMVRRFSVAAGLGIFATGGLLWLVWGRGASVGFADVLDQMKQTRAVRCHLLMDMGNGKGVTENILMVDPGWEVVEGTEPIDGKIAADGHSGIRVVMNSARGKMVSLMDMGPRTITVEGKQVTVPAMKEAVLMDLTNMPPGKQTPNLLDQFKQVDGKDSKPLGEKEIDGVKVKGFDVTKGEQEIEVWADVKTERPVLATIRSTNPAWKAMTYTFSDFDWNPTYDASELTLDVPAGYKVEKTQVDASDVKEADVTAMLKAMTELNDGAFPAKLTLKDIVVTMEKAHGNGSKDAAETAARMNKLMQIGRGMRYMSLPPNGTDWTYAGGGVPSGEKGLIVLWYKPAGGTAWRAFDADFSVHDVQEADLPAGGEPVKMDMTGPMPTN